MHALSALPPLLLPQQRAAPQSEPPKETKRGGACYDEPVEQLRWWTDAGRANATVTSIRNNDIESFWRDAKKDVQVCKADLLLPLLPTAL